MRHDWSVHLMAHVYWHQKARFALERDIYDNWTMFAVEAGRFSFAIGEREGEAEFGDLVVCPPRVPFHRRVLVPISFHFIQFVWEEEPSRTEAEELAGKLTVTDAVRLASNYRYMRTIGSSGTIRVEPAASRIKHMVNDLWRLIELERSKVEKETDPTADPDMLLARQWLLAHAYKPLVMRELSDLLGISPVQLTRRFRAVYRVTPSGFVTGLRLSRACRMLEETPLPLDTIAEQCGYENGFYLSRVFRNNKGTSPSVYRKLHQV